MDNIKECLDCLTNSAYPGYVAAICHSEGEPEVIYGGYRQVYPVKKKMTENTMFDLASLTKVVGTSMLAARYIDQKKLKLESRLGDFFPSYNHYRNVNIQEIMTHTAGFVPEHRLCDYVKKSDNVMKVILEEKPFYEKGTEVHYSCFGYIVLGKILEKVGGARLDKLCKEEVFDVIGMNDTDFCPSKGYKFASTELDKNSKKIICGEVHDENSRFLGGIAGNAGLFSNIKDLSRFAHMLLHSGRNFISEEMFYQMTHVMTKARGEKRGLGFRLVDESNSFFGNRISSSGYGHTGFTGTSIVVDPEKSIAFILLTNRVHPTRENSILLEKRSYIHDLVFGKCI